MGAILAPPIVAVILLHLGWPAAFALVGSAGFIWLAFWWRLYHTPLPSKTTKILTAERPVPVLSLLRNRVVITFTLAKIFLDPVWYFYTFWFREYLKRARGFDLAAIGKFAWIRFAVAGVGNVAGGALAAFLLRRGLSVTVTRKLSVSFFAALMTAAIPAVLARDAWSSIALVSIAMMGYAGALAKMLSLPADVFPGNAVASVYGLAGMGSGFGGMVFSSSRDGPWTASSYTPVCFGFGALPLICAAILWIFTGPLTPAAVASTRTTRLPPLPIR